MLGLTIVILLPDLAGVCRYRNITMNQTSSVTDRARLLYKTQIGWRRHLHQYPELSNREFKTTAFIGKVLKKCGYRLMKVNYPTGVIAELRGKDKGPTVAIRADIDALPVTEKTAVPFKSRVPGVMHACGHDVHTAVALGVAALLAEQRNGLNGNVRFIFQPAEEMPPGGAQYMIASGAMKGVDVIFGLHVEPQLQVGKIGLRDGAVFAANFDFDVIIHGRGGHGARPNLGIDAIVVAAEVINRVQHIVSREIDPIDPVVISFGEIQGGTARNVIADTVRLVGTARWLSEKLNGRIPSMITRAITSICASYGATCEIVDIGCYPLLKNDPAVNAIYRRNWEKLFGKGKIDLTDPVLGSEDFAGYLERVPGSMFRLGIMNKKIKADRPWHSTFFKVDEEAIFYGTALLTAATLDYMENGGK
ncbi:hydrolase [candidate division GN15 bacterium]|uniref:Hydrolase n=1 Tax=candidate division GN15 bacterium TaxID=2072418 RepID=A0A855X2B8_9BACT|nr:MAG: hydrolase [candidate division GN15 bacterium]